MHPITRALFATSVALMGLLALARWGKKPVKPD